MRYTALIPFKAYSGREYELTVKYDDILGGLPERLEEGPGGEIFPIGCNALGSDHWESLSDMTHALKIEIVSWGSDMMN